MSYRKGRNAPSSLLNDYAEKKKAALQRAEKLKAQRLSDPQYQTQAARRAKVQASQRKALGMSSSNSSSVENSPAKTPSKSRSQSSLGGAFLSPSSTTRRPQTAVSTPSSRAAAHTTNNGVSTTQFNELKTHVDSMEKKLLWLYQRDQARDAEFDGLKLENNRLKQTVITLTKQVKLVSTTVKQLKKQHQQQRPVDPPGSLSPERRSTPSRSKVTNNSSSSSRREKKPQLRPQLHTAAFDTSSSPPVSTPGASIESARKTSPSPEPPAIRGDSKITSHNNNNNNENPSSLPPSAFDEMPIGGGSSMPDAFAPAEQQKGECSTCGRSFNLTVLKRHAKICKKNTKKPRKQFKQAKIDMPADYQPPRKKDIARKEREVARLKAKKDWRKTRAQFRNAVVGGEAPADTRIPCSYCGRKFNEDSINRHSNICKKIAKR